MDPIGQMLDALGVEADLNEGDLVSSAVVVCSVLTEGERQPRLLIATSDGMSTIEEAGLLRIAERIASAGFDSCEDDE